MAAKPTKGRAQRQWVPALRPTDKNGSAVSNPGPKCAWPYADHRVYYRVHPILRLQHPTKLRESHRRQEVLFLSPDALPQRGLPLDRCGERTAGSGMWTRTRETAIMEPLRRLRHPLRLISAYSPREPTKQSVSQPRGAPEGAPWGCLLYTSPSPRDGLLSRMPSSA